MREHDEAPSVDFETAFFRKLQQNQEMQERAAQIARFFEIGLNNEENTGGYHGTSIEAVMHLIEYGVLPGARTTDSPDTDVETGNLHFFPQPNKVEELFPGWERLDPEAAIREKRGPATYAYLTARLHYFLARSGLGLDCNNKVIRSYADIIYERAYPSGIIIEKEDELLSVCESLGVPRERAKQLLTESVKRKGVVLMFASNVLTTEYSPELDDEGDELALKIHVPNGLPLKDIAGIEPMGQEEYNFLERIQKSYA